MIVDPKDVEALRQKAIRSGAPSMQDALRAAIAEWDPPAVIAREAPPPPATPGPTVEVNDD